MKDFRTIPSASRCRRSVRKRFEKSEEIKDKQHCAYTLFAHAAIGIAQIATDGSYLMANPRYCDITGYTAKELIELRFQDITHEDDIDLDLEHFFRALSGQIDSYTIEKRYRRKDGKIIWTLLTTSLVRNAQKQPIYFVSTVQDITNSKKLEKQLKESNQNLEIGVAAQAQGLAAVVSSLEQEIGDRNKIQMALNSRDAEMRLIMDGVPIAIAYIDVNQHCHFSNATYAKWMNKSKSEIVGTHIRYSVGDEMYHQIAPYISKCLNGTREDFDTFLPSSQHGSHANIVAMPDFDHNGSVRGCILLFNDITPRIAEQNKLEGEKLVAYAASQAKGSFLAHMSHELRTLIGVILSYTELMQEELPPNVGEEFQGWINIVMSNAELLLQLVNENLDLAKVEAGKVEIDLQRCNIVDIAQEVATTLSIKARKKNIELKVQSLHPDFDPVITDPQRLRQILLNIVDNAIKFTSYGSVTITIDQETGDDQQRKVLFIVKDTGIGMSKDQLQQLFFPYSQASKDISKRFGGTGLGLILAKKFAEALGGDVFVRESLLTQGSTFIIAIGDHGNQHVNLFPNKRRSPLGKKDITQELEGTRILLADDSSESRAITAAYLKKAGAVVEIASNGYECLEKTRAQTAYDLILLDLIMPDINGYETMKRLRQEGFVRSILVFTAKSIDPDQIRYSKDGFNGHIKKPITRDSLIRNVARFCINRDLQ